MEEIFIGFMNDLGHVIDWVFNFFVKDTSVIKDLSKLFTKIVPVLKVNFLPFFDKLNEWLLNSYLENPDNYDCLITLKNLYEVAGFSDEKKEYLSSSFLNLCSAIDKNIMSSTKNQIEIIDLLAQLFSKVMDTVNYIVINQDILNDLIKLFNSSMRKFKEPTLNKNVITALGHFINSNQMIPKEITRNYFEDIVYSVLFSFDYYEGSCLTEVNKFLYFN
jgi:hypothetical protein